MLAGVFYAGGGWEKIWAFLDTNQQSTSIGLVLLMLCEFSFCGHSYRPLNSFCTCTLQILCRKGDYSLRRPMRGQCPLDTQVLNKPLLALKKLSTVCTFNLFSDFQLMHNLLVSFQRSNCHVLIADITSSDLYYLDWSCCLIHDLRATDINISLHLWYF